MKVVFSVLEQRENPPLDMRFGRCTYFQVYDTDSKESVWLKNKGQTADGGAGIAAAQQIIDQEVDVLITGNLGPNAFKLLDRSSIQVYRACGKTVKEALVALENNKLEELGLPGPAHQGMHQQQHRHGQHGGTR